MNQYINQLLEDILAAHRPEKNWEISGNQDIEAHFEEVERYLSGDYEQKLADVAGLYKEQFPPVERLTPEQILLLVDAFDKMLDSYSIHTDLPDKLPIEIAYRLLVSVLDREMYIGNGDGMIGLEFCEYDPKECPFGEKFCSCKDIDIENDYKDFNSDDQSSLF